MNTITIGKLAKRAGMTVETLRYYEHRGLIAPQQRTAAGYRLYLPEALNRLRFIRRAQTLGFSLKDIADLLSLSDNPTESADKVKRITQARIDDIDARLQDLERMRRALVSLADSCPGTESTTADCPILNALNYPDQ
jgi:Zn(II)-responsive transcriptional regulator